jgi:CRP/FNR family transcriptional regulator, cyclic AMP receptor protein
MISVQEFRRYRYFAGIADEKLNVLANAGLLRRFKAGERLLEEGDIAKYLMIVKSGQVDVIYLLGDNRQVVAESAIEGDVIAWSAVLAPYQLTASAVGSKDGELIQIEGARLREMCEADTSLGYQLMTEIAKGLRDRLTGLRVQIAATK